MSEKKAWRVIYPSESGTASIWFDDPFDALKFLNTNGGKIESPATRKKS
jgi:hypothetical protein